MENTNKKIKFSKKNLIAIILVILIIAIVFIIGIAICRKNITKENGNISNMGLAASSELGVFYNKYEDGIVKVKGFEEFQITNETAYSINIVGDEIYYLNIGDSSNINIRKVNINGSGLTTIKTIRTSISKIYVQGDYIYYATNENEDGIAKLTLDGTQEKILTNSLVKDFQVVEDVIYFTNNIGVLYKMTTNGTSLEKINTKDSIKEFQVQDNWVYYFNEDTNHLCKTNITGDKTLVVSEYVNSNIYNVTKNKIYFLNPESKKIASITLDGGNYKEIVSISTDKTKINVVEDTLYYLDSSNDESKIYQMYRVKTNGNEARSIEY